MGRTATNPVRGYFSFDKISNQSTCKIEGCCKILVGNHSSNLEKHVSRCHPKVFQIISNVKERQIKSTNKNAKKRVLESSDSNSEGESRGESSKQIKLPSIWKQKEINVNMDENYLKEACLELITLNGRPFSLLEDSGFVKLIDPILKGLKNPCVISSKSIRSMIEPSSKTIKAIIIEEIKGKLLSLKVDAATRMNRSFLGINVQFIKDGFINIRTLSVYELKDKHSGSYLKGVILEVLKSFDVKLHQIYTMTTDNGANMLKCIELMKSDLNMTNECINSIFGDIDDEDPPESVMESLYEAFKQLEQERLFEINESHAP